MTTTLIVPRRLQLSRSKGFRLADATSNPAGVVSVARTSKWGNPFVVHTHTIERCGIDLCSCPLHEDYVAVDTIDEAVHRFRWLFDAPLQGDPWYPSADAVREHLAGKDLACWCHAGKPCHGDVLLALANPDLDLTPETNR